MINATWTPYGRPAAEALRAAIESAKGGEPLDPVTVIVPSNHVGVASRRLLASGEIGPVCGRGTGLAAVDFLTVYRLAELLGAPSLAATGRRPVSTPVIAAAVRGSLEDAPGRFAPVARHPATEAALVASYRELRDVPESSLDRLSRSGSRAAEVVRLHRDVRRRLEPDWYDEQDLMAAATALVAGGPAAELGSVVVYLPQLLSRHAAELVAGVGAQADVLVLAGTSGAARADAEVSLTLGRLGLTGPPAVGSAEAPVGADRTRVLTASDSDDELRSAVRAVVDAAREGTPLDRMAILHAGPGPYGRLAHEHLTAAGIRANGPSVVPLAARVAGRFLLGLLALREQGFRRADVMAWLSDAPVLVAGRRLVISEVERASRDAGVVAGRAHWDGRLARLAQDHLARAERLAGEGRDDAAERATRSAHAVEQLRELVVNLVDSLAEAEAQPRAWDQHARWARELLNRHLGHPDRRRGWPAAELRAAERIEAALDRLGTLSAVEGPVALDVFERTLELELENDLGRVGRFGDGVLVGPVSMGIGLDLDLVVVVGLAEGTFPASVHDDSLLPDRDREAAGADLPLRRSRVDRQHRELLATLAGARRQLLSFPRGDLRRSIERVPSRWLLDAASTLAGERWWSPDLAGADAAWITNIGSFDAGLRRLDFAATAQEHRLRALLSAADPRTQLADPGDPVLSAGAEAVAARAASRFTRFDGNLAGVALPSPVDVVTSPTSLERWSSCPQAYFQERVLGVREPEHPEDSLRITPRDRGTLVHAILEQFIAEAMAAGDGGPAPDHSWSPVDRQRLMHIAELHFADFERRGLTGRNIFWRRDRDDICRDLETFLHEDSLDRQLTRARLLGAELRFGFDDDEVAAVSIRLPDGRELSFHGMADRVDLAEDGTLHVIDYKTGSAKAYAGLSAENPTEGGALLQLPVYALAARAKAGAPAAPVRAEYWFVSAKGRFEREGYVVDDDVLAAVSQVLGRVVEGVEAGIFPHHPIHDTSPFVKCAYCDPDGLGVGDLRHQWELKRSDPAMATYADVVEPLDEAPTDGVADD